MEMNLGFSVIANCVTLCADPKDEIKKESKLDFDIQHARMFATKLGPDCFHLEDLTEVKFCRKATDPNYLAIILVPLDDDSYIVKNPHQLILDVLEGYIKLTTLEKIGDIIDFDFEAGLDFQK